MPTEHAAKILDILNGLTTDVALAEVGIVVVKLFTAYPPEDRMGLFSAWHQSTSDALTETVL